jgi:signal transduction histidine kinase
LEPAGQLTLTVGDDGKGNDNEAPSTGIGRRTMQQRAAAIGARLDSFSHQFGTTVKLTVRLPKDPKNNQQNEK